MSTPLRPLGPTEILVSPVAFGTWPISGMTSLDVNEADSLATLAAAREAGVNFFDAAYCYGAHGESERLIARALGHCREEIVIATKGGIHWHPDGSRAQDARPATLRLQCEESLERLATDRIDLLYLHAPDPHVPVAESAGALKELLEEGKTRAVGASNCTLAQLQEFAATCPLAAVQPPYNMLQRQIEREMVPWCRERQVAIVVYWPLMKGLLAGRLARDHIFAPGDGRTKYPMFQGQEWEKNQDLVDRLREIAADAGRSVAELAINWTIHQPGITAALCGAKRPWQIEETTAALRWQLTPRQLAAIETALVERGLPVVRRAV